MDTTPSIGLYKLAKNKFRQILTVILTISYIYFQRILLSVGCPNFCPRNFYNVSVSSLHAQLPHITLVKNRNCD